MPTTNKAIWSGRVVERAPIRIARHSAAPATRLRIGVRSAPIRSRRRKRTGSSVVSPTAPAGLGRRGRVR
ncbi:hypothetical protein [Ornithinimicrobium kibberense]|uniref:hypothetical protein n=1 Tax=Ornithinimicrobium kibberense TaxID=282060 RepID=UPI00361BEDB5